MCINKLNGDNGMSEKDRIDITFDARSDTPPGKDTDSHSATLRRYHQILWSKSLPNGKMFNLDENIYHKSELGEFWLSSDCIGRTFTMISPYKEYATTFPEEELSEFQHLGMTIGAFIVFPANKIDNKMTINGMRGFNRSISDRMDLTLECIKRFYEDDGKMGGDSHG